MRPDSLRAKLAHEPRPLTFGTSGRRGDVVDLTQLEIYINVLAELEYLQSLPSSEGGVVRGDDFFLGYDLRPSSTSFVPEQQGRGEIVQAVVQALRDAGMRPVNLGRLPTPAVSYFALQRAKGSIVVTGSHIPFDRNGYKTNTSQGELSKEDEEPINDRVQIVRARIYGQPFTESPFNEMGMLKSGHQELPPEIDDAAVAYVDRYVSFFERGKLQGKQVLVYQHSAVGRDIVAEILQRLGARVVTAGRSESFVSLDTENIDDEQLAAIQALADEAEREAGPLDAVVSTDGDSDRPMILGVEPETRLVRFFSGDLVGMIVAECLGADALVVPITCNDAIDRGPLRNLLEPKTRIGSPFVIAGMQKACAKGRRAVCGWEANGGFLLGSDIERDGRILKALPTRDAILPILCVLSAAAEKGEPVTALFARLPARYSRAALLKRFPRAVSQEIVRRLSPAATEPIEATFEQARVVAHTVDGQHLQLTETLERNLLEIRNRLEGFFAPKLGFTRIARVNYLDGVRVCFDNGDIAHLRPSGNADQLRIYAVADTPERAEAIVRAGIAEPHGILRRAEDWARTEAAIESFRKQPAVLRLYPKPKHYGWGGFEFIPALMGLGNPKKRPFAELWIGAHPSNPAEACVGETTVTLDRLTAEVPREILGARSAERYGGRLPYLFKILDVRTMLSIQAHPNMRQAAEGFAREDAAGVDVDAPSRNYRDDNHKPEVHVALTEFRMLHGFRPLEDIAATLRAVPELLPLMPDFGSRLARAGSDDEARRALLRELYAAMMTLPQKEVDALLNPLIARLERETVADKDSPGYWALRAAAEYPLPGGHRDRGIFSVYLLNLVRLQPGQGTFQPAGCLHAYLEGANVELMANSDNVLRGGLTTKHVDAAELLRILTFESGKPAILEGEPLSAGETVYRSPAEEFELSRIEIASDRAYECGMPHGTDSLIVVEGAVTATCNGRDLELERGGVCLAPHGIRYALRPRAPRSVVFRATIPKR